MDPITINNLLNISNDLYQIQTSKTVAHSQFERIVEKNYKPKKLAKRFREILRIFEGVKFIREGYGQYSLTENFFNFIKSWNEGDILLMNKFLSSYQPYSDFLTWLNKTRQIKVPDPRIKEEKIYLTLLLKEEAKINFFIFDTFKYWSLALGQAYKSPFDDYLIWAGDWSENTPSIDDLALVINREFDNTKKESNYVNAGTVADKVCRKLNISFQAYEEKLNELVESQRNNFVFASITTRNNHSRNSEIITIKKKSNVAQAENLNFSWLEHRQLVDGVKIKGNLFRLMRRAERNL